MLHTNASEQSILIVDDTPDNLTVLGQMLTREGYIVRPALNGMLALKAVLKSRPDLILLDIMMPDIDGYEVCRRLKADEQTREIPVLFISALGDPGDKVKAFEAGGVDYITKPFQTEEVLARVKTHLQMWAMHTQLQEKNTRLQQEINERERVQADLHAAHEQLQHTLDNLVTTQQQLIQSERLASLGRVVAGIAHEIKNPLNFINNFALSISELLDELQTELDRRLSGDDDGAREDIIGLVKHALQAASKIVQHGKRADRIVQDMLDHSRQGDHHKQLTALHPLLDEYIDLGYKGQNGRDSLNTITIEKDYDDRIGQVNIIPHSLGRVILNIVQNASYSLKEKYQHDSAEGEIPTIHVSTRHRGEDVEIRIRDNGMGISPGHLDDIFTPFFTTKPPGKGTGLGLSLSYDIVVQEHQGNLTVETQKDAFTEFMITLPQ